jgi:DNA-binding NtrC family response regulator
VGIEKMRALVLEQNDRIIQLYRSIFEQKKYDADFVCDHGQCLDKVIAKNQYDMVILEKSIRTDIDTNLEDEIRMANPEQRIFFLSPYMTLRDEEFDTVKETLDLIDKPFAMVNLLTQLEIKPTLGK